MESNLSRGSCSHAPLEMLRQEALKGRWSDARRSCCLLGLNDRLDLEVLWAVWAKDADAVGAAVAKAERKPQGVECRPWDRRLRRTES